MAILIKRYANRKLYNTETSRYITLKGIASLLDDGEEVRVIDNETGEDITQVALSQILVGNQRAKEDPSDTLLTQILSKGGDALYGAIRKSVDDATDGLGEFQDRFRNFVKESESIARGDRPFDWNLRPDGDRRSPFAGSSASESASESESSDASDSGSGSGARGARTLRSLRDRPRVWRATARQADAETSDDTNQTGVDLATLEEAVRRAIDRALLDHDVPRATEVDRLSRDLERITETVDRIEALLKRETDPSD